MFVCVFSDNSSAFGAAVCAYGSVVCVFFMLEVWSVVCVTQCVCFHTVRFGSVRFGSVRFGSVRFGPWCVGRNVCCAMFV